LLLFVVLFVVLFFCFIQILDGVRPFLSVAGGAISVAQLDGVGGLQVNDTFELIKYRYACM
jgi:hypothetical protein